MQFGISCAPGIWQKVMDTILTGMKGVICYLDDILISGSTDEEHDTRLHQVLASWSETEKGKM